MFSRVQSLLVYMLHLHYMQFPLAITSQWLAPTFCTWEFSSSNHHHKHQGLDPLTRSDSRVTTALANVSSVFQLFSFLVVCSGMISKGFGFVAFFASVKASSVCIHLSCLVCMLSVVHGVWSRLFCGHKGCSLPEVSIISFLPLQFFISVRLLRVQFSDPYKNVGKIKVLLIVVIQNNKPCLPISNLSVYQKGKYYTGITVFNSLPSQIKELCHNRNQFKRALKNFLYFHSFYILEEYFSYNKT